MSVISRWIASALATHNSDPAAHRASLKLARGIADAWVNRITTAGGTIYDYEVEAVARSIVPVIDAGIWQKIAWLHVPLGDFAASLVLLKNGTATNTLTATNVTSSHYFRNSYGYYVSGNTTGSLTHDFNPANSTLLTSGEHTFGHYQFDDFTGGPAMGSQNSNWYGYYPASGGYFSVGGVSNTWPTQLATQPNFGQGTGTRSTRLSGGNVTLFSDGINVRSFAGATSSPNAAIAILRAGTAYSAVKYGGAYYATALSDLEVKKVHEMLQSINVLAGRQATKCSAVFVGDSITKGSSASVDAKSWPKIVAAKLGLNADVLGVSGSYLQGESGSLQISKETRTTLRHGSVIFVMLGTNDMLSGLSVETYQQQLDTIVGYMITSKVYGSRDIIIESPPYNGTATSALIEQFKLAAKAVSDKYGTKFVDNVSGWSSSYIADEPHPNDAGHALIAQRSLEAVLAP